MSHSSGSDRVSVDQHLERVLSLMTPLGVQPVALTDALGCVAGAEVVAPFDLPRFDNAAMDGYAVRTADVARAPVTLPVTDDLAAVARDEAVAALTQGSAARIMTGAPVPPGADAVVRVEWTDGATDFVHIDRPVPVGRDLRKQGSDLRRGSVVLRAGTELGPAQVALAAALGLSDVAVHRRPWVCVVSTGSELVGTGETRSLPEGAVYDSNSVMLSALAERAQARVLRLPAISDDPLTAHSVLATAAAECDLVVTTGGVSAGAHEVMKDVLCGEQDFHFSQVSMKPGRPQGAGIFEGTPVLTLPGNPVSAFVSFKIFVEPALRKLSGHAELGPFWRKATLSGHVATSTDMHSYVRGYFDEASAGVVPSSGHAHGLAELSTANCLISVPPSGSVLASGEQVDVLPLA